MRPSRTRPFWCSIVCLAILPAAAFAQFGGSEYENSLRPGAHVRYDGESLTRRYNYGIGDPALWANFDWSWYATAEFHDRLDRVAKFGHRWPSARYGRDYQIARIANEYHRAAQQQGLLPPARYPAGPLAAESGTAVVVSPVNVGPGSPAIVQVQPVPVVVEATAPVSERRRFRLFSR